MKPFLHARSGEKDPFLDSIIACITSIDCAKHFANHLGKSQREQAPLVQAFQQTLASSLAVTFPESVGHWNICQTELAKMPSIFSESWRKLWLWLNWTNTAQIKSQRNLYRGPQYSKAQKFTTFHCAIPELTAWIFQNALNTLAIARTSANKWVMHMPASSFKRHNSSLSPRLNAFKNQADAAIDTSMPELTNLSFVGVRLKSSVTSITP